MRDTLWAKCYQKACFIADIDTTSRAESVHAMISPQLDTASSLLDVIKVVDKATQRHNFEASFKAFRSAQVVLNVMNTENMARSFGTYFSARQFLSCLG